jgi:urea transporter
MARVHNNTDTNHLHEVVHYAVLNSERKDVVARIFYVGWMISGLIIIFLALKYGNEAAFMALLAAAVAGLILWLINNSWKHSLYVRYSPDYRAQEQSCTDESR